MGETSQQPGQAELATAKYHLERTMAALETAIERLPKGEEWGRANVALVRTRGVLKHYVEPSVVERLEPTIDDLMAMILPAGWEADHAQG